MNRIESVSIKGFWRDKNLNFQTFSDASFFIGPNGSGKTTVINLLAAALTADLASIRAVEFEELEISFKEVNGRKKPSLRLVKNYKTKHQNNLICYWIKDAAKSEPTKHIVEEYDEEFFMEDDDSFHVKKSSLANGLLKRLNSLTSTSWLSIRRTKKQRARGFYRDDSYISSVDKKLNELSTEISKYFNELTNKVSREISDFQKKIIVDLITEQTVESVFTSVEKLNLSQEEQELQNVFSDLEMSSASKARLTKYFKNLGSVIEKRKNDGHIGYELDEFILILSLYRSHKIVEDWSSLNKKKLNIIEPQTTFLNIVNSLFQRKEIFLNSRNEMHVRTESNKEFKLKLLSSGEKQLLIILGEALLQQSNPWIYITDEPELSLHINWQENLIHNLLRINPNAQILCATHSPDIVSTYTNNVINMEKKIK